MSANNETKAAYVYRVRDTIHSADNSTAGQQTLTNYPKQRKNERFVKHWDYPPHSYIVNKRYNSRNKIASQLRKTKTNSEWQEPATSPNLRPRNR